MRTLQLGMQNWGLIFYKQDVISKGICCFGFPYLNFQFSRSNIDRLIHRKQAVVTVGRTNVGSTYLVHINTYIGLKRGCEHFMVVPW